MGAVTLHQRRAAAAPGSAPRTARRWWCCGLLGAVSVTLGAACGAAPPRRSFSPDRIYGDQCPTVEVAPEEYVVLTVISSRHSTAHLLVGTCEDATLPDCTWTYCGRLPESSRAPRDVCVPGRVFRKLYDRRAGPDGPSAGTTLVGEPLCVKGQCELGFALWVVGHDEAIQRRAACRITVGELRFEDRPTPPTSSGDYESLRLRCEIHSHRRDTPPRECYPPY